ncbi:MAG TPA: hypothetical protein VKE92_14150 [Anaerolineales bacterium]|nr:hypothetical protein [Anaerolineales bacterium]
MFFKKNGIWRRPEQNIGGCFVLIDPKTGRELEEIANTIVGDGADAFLRSLFRGEATAPATYYLGLTNASYTFASATLTAIAAGEPSGNGYARQALVKNTSDWAVSAVNNQYKAESISVTFTASGTWSPNWTRMFLCNASSGTSGIVFALSGARSAQVVQSGQGPTLKYRFWLRA